MTTQRPDPRLGTDLGPYRIEAVIGRGGMGVVYLATHMGLDRRVALKLLTPDYADDEAFRARFLRESKLAVSIDHPNIIPVYDAGEIDGTTYIAMRYVEGTDLQQRLRDGALEPRAATALLTQIASALDAAHAAGLVHRDVKPANVLIAAGQGTEGADHAYLTDFGLTKQRGSQTELTQMGGFLGTLDYIAPEQIEGRELDGRADQYALAAVAVTALTGAPPYPRDSDVAVINAHLHDAPPSLHHRLADLPSDADAVIARGMARSPADRFATCSTFVSELRQALGVTSTVERPVAVPHPDRRRWIGVGLIVGALALTAIVALSGGAAGGLPGTTPGSSLGLGSQAASTSEPIGSAAADPTPDPSAFPTDFEEAALALVPETIRDTCDRGAGLLDSAAAGFVGKVRLNLGGDPPTPADVNIAPKAPTASLTCRPASGASQVHFLWYQIASGISGRDNTVDYLSLLAPRYGADEGDCAKDDKALSSWSNERPSSGLVICFRTAPFDGSPWLDWTFADGHMLALATRDDRDYDALYAWFQDLRTFLP